MRSEIVFAKTDHLEDIYRIWGLNRATLGLMPKDAFKECIKKRWILVSLIDDQIAGYLQFRYTARTQILSIVHLCVDKDFRGKKISEQLLDKLVEVFKNSARGIKLNCRSDYDKAIAFWTRYNFQPKRKLPSRGTDPNVHLITWWFSFGTQDLFSIIQSDKTKVVLDFNIIVKLMELNPNDKAREQIAELQNDWLASEVEFYQTSETTSEIYRDKNKERHKKSQEFLKSFQELNIDKPSIKLTENELLNIFPGTSANDTSDRRQLAETILSGFPYFVTLDEGILKQSQAIFNEYQLKVVQPSTLISEIDISINAEDYYPDRLSGNNFTVGKLKPDERANLDTLFLNNGKGERKAAFNTSLNELVAMPTGNVQLIKESSQTVALIGSYEDGEFLRVVFLRTKQYTLRQTIFLQNLNDLVKSALQKNKSFITIEDGYLTDIEKEILISNGFFSEGTRFIRGINSGLHSSIELKENLKQIISEIPKLNSLVAEIQEMQNPDNYLNVLSLEKILWPLKVKNAEIPCFIVPIKPFYAKELFDTKAAKSELFGVQPNLIWSKENVYYRNVNPNVEKFPARILWYASADKISVRQKSIVCSSYLDEVIVGPAREIYKKHEKFGVYSWQKDIMPLAKGDAKKAIKILRFSNSEAFNTAIPLKKIKEILVANTEPDNNFQSPLRIKSSTFIQLYALGKGIKFDNE